MSSRSNWPPTTLPRCTRHWAAGWEDYQALPQIRRPLPAVTRGLGSILQVRFRDRGRGGAGHGTGSLQTMTRLKKTLFNGAARKRPVNLTLNEDLVSHAELYRQPLSHRAIHVVGV